MSTQRMPSVGTIAHAQFGLLISTKYVAGLLGIVLFSLLVVYSLIPREGIPVWAAPMSEWPSLMTLMLGAVAGAIVWFSEGPLHRRYHWSMPVKRELHDVLRIVAGAVWLMIIVAVFCVIYWWVADPVMREQWFEHAPLFWAGQFLTALLAYLVICVPTLMLGRPLFVILLVITAALVFSLDPVKERLPFLGDVATALISDKQPPSLGVALSGNEQTAPWHDWKEIRRVYWATAHLHRSRNSARMDEEMRREELGAGSGEWSVRMHSANGQVIPKPFDTSQWLQSLALWYVIAILGITFAVHRRPDV
jgi:hypothetical protein